ncbi:MAG: hypothetical protein ACOYKK_02070 [Microbacteriaceae bacterium]
MAVTPPTISGVTRDREVADSGETENEVSGAVAMGVAVAGGVALEASPGAGLVMGVAEGAGAGVESANTGEDTPN